MKYTNAEEWRDEAMQREGIVAEAEIQQRRHQAEKHYKQEAEQPDTDTLADHELYILGKMELAEYEQYLLFKHSQKHKET
ncbi:MAG: hypothetical protein R8M46_06730 [Ghiorsea sp.]